jgi:hypothetical protein
MQEITGGGIVMRIFRLCFSLTLIGGTLFLWGVAGLMIFQIGYENFRRADVAKAMRQCEATPYRCLDGMVIGRAWVTDGGGLLVTDRHDGAAFDKGWPESSTTVSLWGLEEFSVPRSQIHAVAILEQALAEHGPWVACWLRETRSRSYGRREARYTCTGLGPALPPGYPRYDAARDLALPVVSAGLARFRPEEGAQPLPDWAFQGQPYVLSLSSLYLKAHRQAPAPAQGGWR